MCGMKADLPRTAKEARASGLSFYFTGKPCPLGHISPRRSVNRACTACHAETAAKPKHLQRRIDWLKNNKGKAQESSRAWKSRNKPHVLAINASRRAMGQVPLSELDQLIIVELYDLAKRLGSVTGTAWHVDHVIPLKHPHVCGLHVPSNLRVIPAAINIAKKNRFELEAA